MLNLKKVYEKVKEHIPFLEIESVFTETKPLVKEVMLAAKDVAKEATEAAKEAAGVAKDVAKEAADTVREVVQGEFTGLVVLDYDRTMMAHNYPDWYQKNSDYYTECINMLDDKHDLFAGDKPIPAIQWYATCASQAGNKVICVTHEIFNLRDERKKFCIEKYYGGLGIEYYTVDSPEHKIPFIKAYAAAKNIPMKNVVLVDDRMSTVNYALENGVKAVHLSSIVADYEGMGAGDKQ